METMTEPVSIQPYRVLIIEDQTAIREMLAVLVHTMPDFELVGQAGTLAAAVELTAELRPDVVVLDWMFPGGGGVEFLAGLRAEAQRTHVLVFSASTSPHAVREALTGGAKGFVEKCASIADLTLALRAVAAGRVYFGPAVARAVNDLVRAPADESAALSDRERQVLALLAAGSPSKEIATRLGVSMKTVNNHRANLAAKIGLHSIAQLTMHAARLGLIPGPGDQIETEAAAVSLGASN